jgi:hypothetical protein
MPIASYAEAAAWNSRRRKAANKTKALVDGRPGGVQAFREGINFVPLYSDSRTTPENEKLLDEFLDVLASGILAEELVPRENFLHALTVNNRENLFSGVLGPHKYFALAVIAPNIGMVGAIGFQVFAHLTGPATLHGSYYALRPDYRGCGLSHLMLRTVADQAVEFIASARPEAFNEGYIFQFIETNDIAQMTLAERLEDEAIALHPLERDRMWDARCFREIAGIGYRQRAEPPRALALKVQSIDITHRQGRYRADGFQPISHIQASTVLRHVRAFDNLLMNSDEAEAAIRDGRPLTDPHHAGLLNDIVESTTLHTVTPAQAKDYRLKWLELDRHIQDRRLLDRRALAKTMAELAQSVEGEALV